MTQAAANQLREALRRRTPEQLARLLLRVPAIAEALEGRGTLPFVLPYVFGRYAGKPPLLDRLASLLASSSGTDVTLAELDAFSLQLVQLAAWHGGRLSYEQAVAAVGPDHAGQLDAAATALDELLLSDPDAEEWIALRHGVADVIGLPGIPFRDFGRHVDSPMLAQILRHHGVAPIPSKKMERLDAVERCLRDGDGVQAVVARQSQDARRIFQLVAEHGPQRVADVGIPYFSPWGRAASPLHDLLYAGLVGVDSTDQVCWVWLDVLVGLNGGLFASWPPAPPTPEPKPLRDTPGLPPVLGRLTALLHTWANDPAPALASGGLGVRPVRATAKALGLPPGEVGLLASLAVELGLLGRVHTGSSGRGRKRTDTWTWTPTRVAEQFAALPAERRWALLVQAWRDSTDIDETEGLPERVEQAESTAHFARSTLLRLLAELPAGTGVPLDELTALAESSLSGGLRGPVVAHVVDAARILGLVPPDGPVGLTALGRALLDGPAALAAALPPPRAEFTVQADLTIVAPPDLAPDVATELEHYAELESATGARIYRLTERRLMAALDADVTADHILAFLAEHSTTALAQNLEYLVRDCARRHGRVRAGSCTSYLRSDDPALLSAAVAVKPAKLRLLAPTVAVSPLSRAKLVAALRARSIMAVAEDADGAALTTSPANSMPANAEGGLPQLRDALELRPADARKLAKRIAASAKDVPPAPPQPREIPLPGSAAERAALDRFLEELQRRGSR